MPSRRNGQLLARVNFPPYAVHVISERHFLVAGGGGPANTGIKNIIEIYELVHDGSFCRAKSVTHYDTGKHVIMNCSVIHNGKHFVIAAGMGGSSQIYQMKYKILKDEEEFPLSNIKEQDKSRPDDEAENSNLRRRGSKAKSNEQNSDHVQSDSFQSSHQNGTNGAKVNGTVHVPKIGFDIQPIDTIQTDFNQNDDPFQKIVRFTSDNSVMITAGSDGYIRTWKYPDFQKLYEINAHENEVDDLDISPSGNKIVSCSRDGHAYIWNLLDGRKNCELQYTLPNNDEKYNFRGCRYGIVENDKNNYRLFTTLIPKIRKKPLLPCYILKWDTQKYVVENLVSTGTDMLSALTVSDDGRFLGLGTLNGTVDIYIAFSLKRLYHLPNAHSFFVTGLEFLKSADETKRITGDQDVSLISVSVDNHISIHHVPKQGTTGLVGIVVFFVIFLLLIYVLLDFLNL